MPNVDKTTYVRHKSRERKRSKRRNAEVAASPEKILNFQDESKNVKSVKSTSIVKNLDQKPKSMQNWRESMCARVARQKQAHGQQVSDAKKIKVDKATYVRYRDKKHVKKQESDISIRAQKSIRLFNLTTKTDKSTYVRYHSGKNHGTTNVHTQDSDDQLNHKKQKLTNDTVRRVDKSTYVRCHSHKQKNLPEQQTTGNDKSKREAIANRVEKSTFVRFTGIDARKPEMRTLSTERTSMHLEAATQNSYDGTDDRLPQEELGPPNTNVKTNKSNEDTQYISKHEAGVVEKAIRYIKRHYRSTFDAGTRTEDYLILEEKHRDSPYQPKTVNPGNISVKNNPVENSEIFIQELDYEYDQRHHSQSFVVDFGTNAIQRLMNITKNITSNFVDDEDESYCKCKHADKKDFGHQVDCVSAEVGVQVASIDRRKYVNKKINNTEGAVQTKVPQQIATEELIKCVEKYLYTNKYNQEYEDVGAQVDEDGLHKNSYQDQTVQANFSQKHGGADEKCIKGVDKKICAKKKFAHVGVQKDMILYKKRVHYINNALQTDFIDGNILQKFSKGVIQNLLNEDTGEVGLQADFEDSQKNQSLIFSEQGVQAAVILDENKTKCKIIKNITNENACQNVQEYNEQNLISKVFEEKERQRRNDNFSITSQENKTQKKDMVQCGVQSDKTSKIDSLKACVEKNSNDSALVSRFCSELNILRVDKSAGDSQRIEAETKIEAQKNPVEKIQLCACPEGETCTNECKLVEMKICTNEKIPQPPNKDEVHDIDLKIRDCATCEKGGFFNNSTGLAGKDGAPVTKVEHGNENKNDAKNKKREKMRKLKNEERETKRGKKGKSKTQDESHHETCDPHICKSLEHLIKNIPCAKIPKEADNNRPIGIHIKYRTPQRKYMESYTQRDEKLKDGHGRRLACEGETCGLDYYQLALNLMKKIEQNRRLNMSRNSYEPTFGPPMFRHHHWDNPCESIHTDNPRYRAARSSSRLSDTNQNHLLGNSRSRSCKCLDVSSLGSQDDMATADKRWQPQPCTTPNCKHHGSVTSRPPLGLNMDRYYRGTQSPHQMPDRQSPNYKYQTNPTIARPCRDTDRPHQFPTSSDETSDGSGIYLSREPYYQFERKSSCETSDCYYKNMLQNVLQKVPQYSYDGYETMPTSADSKDAGCDPIPELKQEKRRIWEGLFRRQCCRKCDKSQCKKPQEVVDAAAGPCEGELKPGGTSSSCQQRCQLTTYRLPCRYEMEEWEQIKAQGEGCWNASSHSCGNLLEYDHSNDFDWVPANYFIQAKSSISEGSSGFSMFLRPKESVYLVAEKEEDCICDVPSACRQLFMKLKQCCGQTYVPETPSEDDKDYKVMAIPSWSQGFKFDVAGKGSLAPGLRCCPEVKTRTKYSYRHYKL